MSVLAVQQLINSMSGPEKRHFKRYAAVGGKSKEYIQLFDLLNEPVKNEQARTEKLTKTFSTTELDAVSRYLMDQLTDCLVQLKVNKDPQFQLYQGLMRVKILQERSLYAESDKRLLKLRQKASELEQPSIQYLTYRLTLDRWNASSFSGVTDHQLVDQQMRARELLKGMNYIQDHYSLFEMMKFRLLQGGQILADTDKKKLNDLMLSELVLMAGRHENNFTTQKLHLLFQSYFLTTIGDFESAIKTYRSLNDVFEKNRSLLDHPPLDYLAALDGILSSLRRVQQWSELDYYKGKLEQLDNASYPEYFRYQVRKSIALGELSIALQHPDPNHARHWVETVDKNILEAYHLVNEEKQWELYFFISIVFFRLSSFKKAHTWVAKLLRNHTVQPNWLICKATRLLDLILYFQQGDATYLEYEIRSYQRFFRKEKKLLMKTEDLVIKLLQIKQYPSRKALPALHVKKLKQLVCAVEKDKYEWQLLAYFDFAGWVKKQLPQD